MGNPALDALAFIIGTVMNLYAGVVALRFVMQTVRADYYNPFSQAVVKLTDPLLRPLRRIVPSFRRYDTASIVLCLAVLLLKLVLFKLLGLSRAPAMGMYINAEALSIVTMLPAVFIDFINLLFNIVIYSMIIQALLSWIPGAYNNPVYGLLRSITDPVLAPVRRFVPPIGGLDLSVMVAIIALFALQMVVVRTLINALLG